jgi:uncharacterized protein (TIRG00374 family)
MADRVRTVIGVLLGVVLLWILFRGTDWKVLQAAIGRAEPGWLLMALALGFASLFVRVQRWSYVVRATHPATFRSLFSAVQIGLAVNLAVPARLGDLVRGLVLARLTRMSLARSIALVALDRINDILALVSVLLVTVAAFPTDTDIHFASDTFGNPEPFVVSSSLIRPTAIALGIGLLVATLLLVLLYFSQSYVIALLDRTIGRVSATLADRLRTTFLNAADGMHVFRSAADLVKAALFSLLTWALVALSLAAILRAFHLEFPWYGPLLVLSILGVFTSVTVTPGMVGQYHVPVVAALLMIAPRMDPSEAKAVAIAAHVVAVIPPTVLGLYSMLREGLRVSDLAPGPSGATRRSSSQR